MTIALSWPFGGRTTLSGMGLAASAFALLTSVDTIFKLIAAGGHPAWQILLVNACFALVPILLWTASTGGMERLATRRLPHHLARGAVSAASSYAAIYAYSRLPLTDFYAIVFAGPLMATAMAAFWLGERVDGARWAAMLIGFVGIVIDPLASPVIAAHGAELYPSFQYTQILWGALAGYVLWQIVPSGHVIAGSAVVASSGLFLIYREMRTKQRIPASA